jgi:transcriptional regulator with XRE-family HTH domain
MKIVSKPVHQGSRLADRIRVARHAAKLSQAALAKRLGVTSSAAAQWEHTKGTRPGIERLQAIASATGVTLGWLVAGQGDLRRRRPSHDDPTPALKLDFLAQDQSEELVLDRFRVLSSRARDALCHFLQEVTRTPR